jgi:hypothetical protein
MYTMFCEESMAGITVFGVIAESCDKINIFSSAGRHRASAFSVIPGTLPQHAGERFSTCSCSLRMIRKLLMSYISDAMRTPSHASTCNRGKPIQNANPAKIIFRTSPYLYESEYTMNRSVAHSESQNDIAHAYATPSAYGTLKTSPQQPSLAHKTQYTPSRSAIGWPQEDYQGQNP